MRGLLKEDLGRKLVAGVGRWGGEDYTADGGALWGRG